MCTLAFIRIVKVIKKMLKASNIGFLKNEINIKVIKSPNINKIVGILSPANKIPISKMVKSKK